MYGDAGHDSRIKTNNYLFTRDVAILGTNPLSVSIRLLTASTINTCCAANVIPTLNGYIDTDFSHTLQWEVQAFDAQDHNITDAAALRLASGSPLPRILVAPEPSTLWFMSAGALALVFRNLWGQRRSVLRRMTVREP